MRGTLILIALLIFGQFTSAMEMPPEEAFSWVTVKINPETCPGLGNRTILHGRRTYACRLSLPEDGFILGGTAIDYPEDDGRHLPYLQIMASGQGKHVVIDIMNIIDDYGNDAHSPMRNRNLTGSELRALWAGRRLITRIRYAGPTLKAPLAAR